MCDRCFIPGQVAQVEVKDHGTPHRLVQRIHLDRATDFLARRWGFLMRIPYLFLIE
ncbi:MAG: hypothetical protein HC769_00885 [Cyanobacteria bacterium CRU_2_1]|nr:hypothetical protein [Cyanobacteria bacterium CRU_2_1]